MNTSIPEGWLRKAVIRPDPGKLHAHGRQPIHSVYGGAQLFTSETFTKLATLARRSLDQYARTEAELGDVFALPVGLRTQIYARIIEKLDREAVEDFRVDFEDGYGVRSNEDEDTHALAAAEETAKAMAAGLLPPFFGIRIKALNPTTRGRAIRTLDIYLTALVTSAGSSLPRNFVVTLPKVAASAEVALLADLLDEFERVLGLDAFSIKIEIMVETARSLVSETGTFALPAIVAAARGRCVAAHFGAYDYTADLGVISSEQGLRHPSCDLARGIMQLSLAGTGVRLADGATSIMPIAPHRGDQLTPSQEDENRTAVHAAWKLHYDNVRHALSSGFYQGWDLHPAQLIARYAAVYAFFLEGLDEAAARLKSFIDKGARANLVGTSFDDAATAQGLLNYFRRAIDSGAITEAEALDRSGLTIEELRQGTFSKIIELRAARNS